MVSLEDVSSRILCISHSYEIASLDKAELGGSNVKSIDIGSKASEGLLGAVRAVGHTKLATGTILGVHRREKHTGSRC